MSIKNAFNYALSLNSKEATLKRFTVGPDQTGTIRVSFSNYFRNQEGPSNTVFEGREFVISKDSVTGAGFTSILRGDRLVFSDAEIQEVSVDVVREMTDLGGEIIGYRVTTK